MPSDGCTVFIGPECVHGPKHPADKMPVKLEVITEEGETFIVAMTRSAWAQLLLGGKEVPGWIEPLEAH